MDPLTEYYVQQSGEGLAELIGPVYHQRGYGIGSFFGSLFRIAKPYLVRGAKTVGKKSLLTGAQILQDIATKPPGTRVRHIVTKRLREATLSGGSKKKRRAQVTRRDIFS